MFNRSMYGALLRYQRTEAGYRKGDEFVADLSALGLKVPVATLYRIERGEQEPGYSFIAAVNLLLFGDAHSGAIIDSCIPEAWTEPEASSDIMRALSRSGALSRIKENGKEDRELEEYYDHVLSGINSYDFDVFPNGKCDEDHLYMTVRYGAFDEEFPENAVMESYEITDPGDVERSIINFLKSYHFNLPGKEVLDLVRYGERKMKEQLEAYEIYASR
ncbi:MAG: helix-turn-helix domain-containing protein [Eggerthellaceae bacterium]|nr:helix-turn-helix domain-containing protein [Eggerthellaceae bacterium]